MPAAPLFAAHGTSRRRAAGHVLAEFREGATEVSEDHIRDFCDAIYQQDPIHPTGVCTGKRLRAG